MPRISYIYSLDSLIQAFLGLIHLHQARRGEWVKRLHKSRPDICKSIFAGNHFQNSM